MTYEQKQAYTEVLKILSYMEQQYVEKIPKKLIEFFERNSAKDYDFDIDLNISLKEQTIQDKTSAILAMINLNYWCDTPEEKQKWIEIYSGNEKELQNELKNKYNPDDIFKKKKKIEINNLQEEFKDSSNKEEIIIIKAKETFFEKLINRLKEFFKKK